MNLNGQIKFLSFNVRSKLKINVRNRLKILLIIVSGLATLSGWSASTVFALNSNSLSHCTKLIFIHHSCGENWLADDNGGLGLALKDNNYFVSDTNYGWGPDSIGDHTDIGHWYDWFRGPQSTTYVNSLYLESENNSGNCYSRLSTNPGGENEIIMFKSCFPNSNMNGNSHEPPATGVNPLQGENSWSEYHTVGNAKGIYIDLLDYFATKQDKLFIAVTAPPLAQHEADASNLSNIRAFNNWLVNEWLADYPHNNVAVFDFYNVLTSNAGSASTNDAGRETGNHHRILNGEVQHIKTVDQNYSAYPSGDSHPSPAGNQKATKEFLPLLNVYYHCWKGTGDQRCLHLLPGKMRQVLLMSRGFLLIQEKRLMPQLCSTIVNLSGVCGMSGRLSIRIQSRVSAILLIIGVLITGKAEPG